MADPITDPRPGRLTPITYGVDDGELDVLITIMEHGRFATPQAAIDCALGRLATLMEIPMSREDFALGRKRGVPL